MKISELNEAFDNYADWDKFLAQVEHNTDINNHGENYVFIANYFGLNAYAEKFQEFIEIANKEQGLDLETYNERYKLYCHMFDDIEKLIGTQKARQLRSCT